MALAGEECVHLNLFYIYFIDWHSHTHTHTRAHIHTYTYMHRYTQCGKRFAFVYIVCGCSVHWQYPMVAGNMAIHVSIIDHTHVRWHTHTQTHSIRVSWLPSIQCCRLLAVYMCNAYGQCPHDTSSISVSILSSIYMVAIYMATNDCCQS